MLLVGLLDVRALVAIKYTLSFGEGVRKTIDSEGEFSVAVRIACCCIGGSQ